MKYKKAIAIISIILLALLMFIAYARCSNSALHKAYPKINAGSPKPILSPAMDKKVVMIIVDRMDVKDLGQTSLPNFNSLMEQGAVGLMNCNTAGNNMVSENTYATIGAGSHILATGTSSMGFNAGDKLESGLAAEEYKRRTGRSVSLNSLVHLGIARIQLQNSSLSYPALPGALGTILHNAGLKTAVFGNSDIGPVSGRQVLTVAMDKSGVADYGNLGSGILIKDEGFPSGLRTDYNRLLVELDHLPGDVALTVIDTGDLSRLSASREYFFEGAWLDERQRTLRRIDQFLGKVMERLDLSRDLLLVISPTPEMEMKGHKSYVTPVMAMGAGAEKGFLFSPSTKRNCIILNTDIAPTIIHFLNLDIPDRMTGQPMQAARVEAGNLLGTLQAMQEQLVLTYNARPLLQKAYVLYQLCLLGVCLYYVFMRRNQAIGVIQPFLLTIMAVPLVYMLLPLLPQPSFMALSLEMAALTFGITLLALICERCCRLGSFIFLSLASAGIIIIDAMVGSPLQKTSIMSYDPIVGARFYGIGNEYMGVLIGSLIIGSTAVLSKFPSCRKVLLFFTGMTFLIAFYVLASPRLGSNMGGAIAFSAALLTTFLLLCNVRFKFRTVVFLVTAIAGLFLALLIMDLYQPVEVQTHFGRNANLILKGGWPEIIDIITRKVEMNIKLIKYTLWSRVFIASLGVLAVLFYRPVGVMAKIRETHPELYRGFIGVVTGGIIALIFNDSGIVAAATTMIFGAPPIILLALREQGQF